MRSCPRASTSRALDHSGTGLVTYGLFDVSTSVATLNATGGNPDSTIFSDLGTRNELRQLRDRSRRGEPERRAQVRSGACSGKRHRGSERSVLLDRRRDDVASRRIRRGRRDQRTASASSGAQGVQRLVVGCSDENLPSPKLGKTANARTVRGEVLVGIPSRRGRVAQKGVKFVPLEEARQIPIGSFLDTSRGTVALTTARNSAGRDPVGPVQRRAVPSAPVAEAEREGADRAADEGFRSRFQEPAPRRAATPRPVGCRGAQSGACVRDARGRYRTRGRHSAATVRGTVWERRRPLRRHSHEGHARQGYRPRLPTQGRTWPSRAARATSHAPPPSRRAVAVVVLRVVLN